MIKEAIGTGSTVDEAKEAACRQLGIETFDAEFEILQMPAKKTFGLFGGAPAKVRVYIKETPAQAAEEYLKSVLNGMDLGEITVTTTESENDGVTFELSGEGVGAVIGHRGETLDALQYLVGLVANHVENSYYKVTINIGDYREKRERTLESLGRGLAFKAAKSGEKTELEPMNPYERRIIHTAVQKVNGAISWSEGENLKRHVVIGPDPDYVRPRRRDSSYKGRRGYGKQGYNNNRKYKNYSPTPSEDTPKRPPINEGGTYGLYGRIDNPEKS